MQVDAKAVYVLELPWPPITGNRSVKHTKHGHYKCPKAVAYRAAVARSLSGQGVGSLMGQKPLVGPLIASWVLAPPDKRARDMDNVRKEIADALTLAGFWADDSNKVLVREVFEWTDPVAGGAIALTVEVR
jgi:Holliday junction resolvase RusA-like endonuclease